MNTLQESLIHRRVAGSPREGACYGSDTSVPTLSVYCHSAETWIFPWSHLSSAAHTNDGGDERLTLQFATHVVQVVGERLDTLIPAIAGFHLSSLRSVPRKYKVANLSEPYIARLSIEPLLNTGGAGSADLCQTKPGSSNDSRV